MSKLVPSIFKQAEAVMRRHRLIIDSDIYTNDDNLEDIRILARALMRLDGEINSVLSLTDTTCDDAKKLEAALMSSAVGREAIEHVKFCNPELFNRRVFSGRA